MYGCTLYQTVDFVMMGMVCFPLLFKSIVAPSPHVHAPSKTGPQIKRGNILNLSILVSGGKETNPDSLNKGQ